MAITTLDAVLAGLQPMQPYIKAISPTLVAAGKFFSPWYLAGVPGPGSADTSTANGIARSSSSALVAGQIPFYDPGGGQNTNLARFFGSAPTENVVAILDRLWDCGAQSSGSAISPTSTSAQTINSTAWPARDKNGSTNGENILVGLEVSSTMGSPAPTGITLTYTNSDGTGSRSSALVYSTNTGAPAGAFFPFGLQAGDKGVRSVQSIQLASTWTSGQFVLVAYRILAMVGGSINSGQCLDPITGGFGRLYNGTVPMILGLPSNTNAINYTAMMQVARG